VNYQRRRLFLNLQRRVFLVPCLLVVFLGTSTALTLKQSQGQDILQKIKSLHRDVKQKIHLKKAEPRTGSDNAIECLAREIDWLENYLDEQGSVVAKQPDIWGEARLTTYRWDVEKELEARLSSFKLRDNASIIRTDIAELATAISIGKLADTPGASSLGGGNTTVINNNVTSNDSDSTEAPPAETKSPPSPLTNSTFTALGRPAPPSTLPTAETNLEPTIELNQLNRYLSHLNQLRRINEGDDTSDAPGYALNLVRIPVSIMPGRATRSGYGAEVTISAKPILSDTLLPNTFRNLVVNDLVDQLGLPILRYAESGKIELALFLAENSVLAYRIQEEIERLPKDTSFQDLTNFVFFSVEGRGVSPDANITIPFAKLAKFIDGLRTALNKVGEKDLAKNLTELSAFFKLSYSEDLDLDLLQRDHKELLHYVLETLEERKINDSEVSKKFAKLLAVAERESIGDDDKQKLKSLTTKEQRKIIQSIFMESKYRGTEFDTNYSGFDDKVKSYVPNLDTGKLKEANGFLDQLLKVSADELGEKTKAIQTQLQDLTGKVSAAYQASFASSVSTSKSRRTRYPMSPAIAVPTFGEVTLRRIALQLRENYKGRYVVWNESDAYKDQIHLVDTRQFLRENLDSAYDVLAQREFRELLYTTIEGSEGLCSLVANGNISLINEKRESFLAGLQISGVDIQLSHYCWCLALEMGMLNKRLNEDVNQLALSKGNCECQPGCDNLYYLPLPNCNPNRASNAIYPNEHGTLATAGCQSGNCGSGNCANCSHTESADSLDQQFYLASRQFQCYVECRWPIHVFTIDPVHQEQNISEASVVKRELAIAAALSFASGNINLNQLNRFQRQFQEDISTVGLNRTQTGFVHGNETFGWRFSPRIQTRRSQGTLKAFAETTFGRKADANWSEATLEPGMRECTAIVLMPSFVPYCDFDVRTNWFQLTRPTHTDVSIEETMKLSRAVTQMRRAREECVSCSNLYRPGEIDRLVRRVDQLETMIPLQTLRTQIPYENTLGGYELFSNGMTDLGPELSGWYGSPGVVIGFTGGKVDPDKRIAKREEKTTLFLVGDNLSVHETRVIAGGVEAENLRLISRQVLEVTIPDTAQIVTVEGRKYVAVYAATPYGATSHLHIPVVMDDVEGANAKSIADLKKDLLAKIAESSFKWSGKQDIKVEVCFARKDSACVTSKPRLLSPSDEMVLQSNVLKTNFTNFDSRRFAIIGVLKSEKTKKPVGSPVLLNASTATQPIDRLFGFTGKQLKLQTSQIFSEQLIQTIESSVLSTMFENENSLKLTVETYIVFADLESHNHRGTTPQITFGEPIRIGEDHTLTITASDSCDTRCLPTLQVVPAIPTAPATPTAPAIPTAPTTLTAPATSSSEPISQLPFLRQSKSVFFEPNSKNLQHASQDHHRYQGEPNVMTGPRVRTP